MESQCWAPLQWNNWNNWQNWPIPCSSSYSKHRARRLTSDWNTITYFCDEFFQSKIWYIPNQPLEPSKNHLESIQNGTIVIVNWTSLEYNTCSDLLCDKEIINSWLGHCGCGCYHINHMSSNLALEHTIHIHEGENIISMLNFGSIKFSKLCIKYYITPSVKTIDLITTDKYFNLLDCIRSLIFLWNKNCWFVGVVWYNHGLINYIELVDGRINNSNGLKRIETMTKWNLMIERSTLMWLKCNQQIVNFWILTLK